MSYSIIFSGIVSQDFSTVTDFKKVSQGDEYQNFLLKKKFFIHLIFYLLRQNKRLRVF